jgi:DNA-binding NtrC family response regulator
MSEQVCYRILIVDDDETDIMAVKRAMGCSDCSYTVCNSGAEALETFASDSFDCIILDYRLPDVQGDELFDQIQSIKSVPVIMITGHGSERLAVKLIQKGAANYLPKDHLEYLQDAVFQAIEYHAAFLENVKRLQEKLDRLEK